MSISLTQVEADYLIALPKFHVEAKEYQYPGLGGALCISLFSEDRTEEFLLDIRRASINLSKNKFQKRAKKVVPLIRLDINSSPHRNPDGEEVPPTHVHIYRENWADKWAYPLPDIFFTLSDHAAIYRCVYGLLQYRSLSYNKMGFILSCLTK